MPRRSAGPRAGRLTAIERRDAAMQQLFRLALPLGLRAARPLDVGARAIVAAVEKQHARPDVDGRLVVAGEVMIEPLQQQLLDARLALGAGERVGGVSQSVRSGSDMRQKRWCHGRDRLDYPANRHGPSTHALCYKVAMAIIECVPNISEGRRPDVVRAIVDAVAATPGVRLLDLSSDRRRTTAR